jgi:hypothetical protein
VARAIELYQQGRTEELWQMCCGYLNLNLEQFMSIQKRLMEEQIRLLNKSLIGLKIMRGSRPRNLEEFREQVPLTTYADYCPELVDKKEEMLPAKTAQWVHTSGKSGEYSCKWIPISQRYAEELSKVVYGLGLISSSRRWGDTIGMTSKPKIVYTVAPRPYMSGALASMVREQTPTWYLPDLESSESMSFQDRTQLGFQEALVEGLDYFFGLSMVLVAVGNKICENVDKVNIRPYLRQPKALLRLTRGMLKSKLAGRPMMPRDLWHTKGIMCGGLDSSVYRERIKELWGRYPLDTYACSEGGIIATQIWDYDGMTFIPHLNFLEFIPEKEHERWRSDNNYKPTTVLLDEVKPGNNYEIVITNFHGGALVRYRIGDMVRITSLKNSKSNINIPQMVFERRVDDIIDFVVIRLTEKQIWQAIEKSGVAYEDWIAFKEEGKPVLNILMELKNGYSGTSENLSNIIHNQLMKAENDEYTTSRVHDDLADMIDFRVKVMALPLGAFSNYTERKQREGADLAHLKPPHINPSKEVITKLQSKPVSATQERTSTRTEKTVVS